MSTAPWQGRRLPIPAAWPVRSSPAARPWAIVSAALAPILLTGGYLVAGAPPPASYSPLRTTISALAGQARTHPWRTPGGILPLAGCYPRTASRRPGPGPATGGRGGGRDGATARARARGRRQDWRDAPTHVGPPAGGGAWWRCACRPGATRWAARYRHRPATRSGPGRRGSP